MIRLGAGRPTTSQVPKVLIVEPEGAAALDLKALLSKQGCAISGVVDSGVAAIEAVRKSRPDLVLMDVHLRAPLDGIAVARDIRREQDVPIVYLAAYGDEDAVQRLFEAERWMSATLASVGEAVIATDEGGRIRYVNPAAEQLTNWPAADAIGRPLAEVLRIAKPISAATAEESLLVRRDGGRVPIELAAKSIDDGSGGVIGSVMVLRDIAALKSKDRRFRELLDSAPDPMVIVDSAGKIVLVNSQTERMFGYARAELLGQAVELLIPDRLRARHPALRDGYFATPRVREMGAGLDLFARRKDGSELPVEISLSPLETEEGTLVSAAIRDVTERKRAAAALELARDEARASERHKAEFLASMSHEIRTPMNAVIGFTGLLLDGALSAEQREYARQVRASAESLLSLINDILDFSKIEAGKLTIEPISFDLEAAAGEALELFGSEASGKNIDLLLRYAAGTPTRVIGDPGRIRQILTNLIGNAVKFTEAGHVLVDVEALEREDDSALVRVSVSDTGPGIPADQQSRLFQKFVQVDASSTRQHSGTGLGLAISKQLIELMGGEIGLTSEVGRGSDFWFTLRMRVDTTEPPELDIPDDLRALRVLVVDDNKENRALLDELISRWKMRGSSVASGAEALRAMRDAAAAGDPYRIALLDFHMPGMDGEELARTIKATPEIGDVVLLLLTSAGQFGDERRAKEVGFAAYLTKPLRPSMLRDAVLAAWATRALPREAGLVTRQSLVERFRPEPMEGPAGISARVLVVEDNPANQKLARLVLERMGCRVDTAGNGREAVELIEDIPYDIVFMDCQMPEMDGYEATREIRARERAGQRLPIIALTAANMAGDSARCLEAGMDDYVSKPMRREDLRRALERWVPVAGRRARPPAPPVSVEDVTDEFDPVRFAKLWGDVEDPTVRPLADLAASFLRNTKRRITTLRQAVSSDDFKTVKEVSHNLRGASGQYGADLLQSICREIESGTGKLSPTEATSLVDELERETARLEAAVRRYLADAAPV